MAKSVKVKVRPEVRALAKRMAGGDESRLEDLNDGYVLIRNHPKSKKAPRP